MKNTKYNLGKLNEIHEYINIIKDNNIFFQIRKTCFDAEIHKKGYFDRYAVSQLNILFYLDDEYAFHSMDIMKETDYRLYAKSVQFSPSTCVRVTESFYEEIYNQLYDNLNIKYPLEVFKELIPSPRTKIIDDLLADLEEHPA